MHNHYKWWQKPADEQSLLDETVYPSGLCFSARSVRWKMLKALKRPLLLNLLFKAQTLLRAPDGVYALLFNPQHFPFRAPRRNIETHFIGEVTDNRLITNSGMHVVDEVFATICIRKNCFTYTRYNYIYLATGWARARSARVIYLFARRRFSPIQFSHGALIKTCSQYSNLVCHW
jgi:hypothetical protein